jgi:hypothetical protein
VNSSTDDRSKFEDIIQRSAKAELTKARGVDGVFYELEKTKLDLEKVALERDHLKEDLENKRQDRQLRKDYANKIFSYLTFYSIFCAFTLISQGMNTAKFSLPDNVLVALVGSTAVAVVCLVGWVVKGLFKPPDDK